MQESDMQDMILEQLCRKSVVWDSGQLYTVIQWSICNNILPQNDAVCPFKSQKKRRKTLNSPKMSSNFNMISLISREKNDQRAWP